MVQRIFEDTESILKTPKLRHGTWRAFFHEAKEGHFLKQDGHIFVTIPEYWEGARPLSASPVSTSLDTKDTSHFVKKLSAEIRLTFRSRSSKYFRPFWWKEEHRKANKNGSCWITNIALLPVNKKWRKIPGESDKVYTLWEIVMQKIQGPQEIVYTFFL